MSAAVSASFIASALHTPGSVDAPADYLRREFTVDAGLVRATLQITALGLIDTYVNGTRVGDEVLTPGWTAYEHRLIVRSCDVTGLLTEGANALGAVLGEGWAVGWLTWTANTRQLWADRPAGFLQLDLEYAERVDRVGTGPDWRAGHGGVRENGIYNGETYDARLELAGWSTVGFDDADWSDVETVDVDPARLAAATAPPIRRVEEMPVRELVRTPEGRLLADFGQVLTGWVRLRVNAPEGTTITLHHCEAVIADEPAFATNRAARATDQFTSAGGLQEWEPRFTFHGFRFVEITGWPGELDPSALSAVVVHSDMARSGWFECSDPMLEQLHRNVVWSMRGNFVGVPTDCPQRDERLGWTGDINAFAPTAAFLYNVEGVLGSWLVDLAAEQAAVGRVPFVVPDAMRQAAPPTALWGDVAVSLPWLLYQEYGDTKVLERQYCSMTAFVDQVGELLDADDLWSAGFQFGDWLDPDAPPDNPAGAKTDAHFVAGAYFCKVTSEMAAAAEVLGRDDDAARYGELHERVLAGFRREWVAPSGRLVSEAATAYALAICFGILNEQQQVKAGKRLSELVAAAEFRISTGFAGTPLIAHALSRTGQLSIAYKLLLERSCPSFLYPLTMGATTIWERWDAIKPDGTLNDTGMTSLNHYALGAVADWMHKVIGGLAPASPGYRTMRIAPQPGGGLTHASVVRDTPYGRVRVAWQRADGSLRVDVSLPEGTSAQVVLPEHPDNAVHDVTSGDHTWEYTSPAPPERRAHTMQSSMAELAEDELIWPQLAAVFAKHFPDRGAGDDAGSFRNARLVDIVSFAGGHAPGLEADLAAVIAS